MSFVNSYKAPESNSVDLTSKAPYDVNCCIPVLPSLESERVKLVPFVPHIHSEAFHEAFRADSNLARWLPVTWQTVTSFNKFLETAVRADSGSILFAIIDKTKPDYETNLKKSLAGAIGLLHISPSNLAAEIGPVVILTEFQRTFVSSNAIGLLLQHCLNVPAQGGLGFRRLVWTANPFNKGSIRAAERMGFVAEGVQRWTWILPEGKEGNEVNGNDRGERPGRDSTILACCWDDWEGGIRERVKKLMDRV